MAPRIRLLAKDDIDRILDLSVEAWGPVFASWQQILGPTLYPIAIYRDWRSSQRDVVRTICADGSVTTWVAEVSGEVIGFVAYRMNHAARKGEIELLAVSPDRQSQGVGTQLTQFALQKLKEGGMRLAVVGTGGDAGHGPARRCYEKAGFTGLPLVRYYKQL